VLLLLDEPAAGLRHKENRRSPTAAPAQNRRVSILLVEHDMEFVMGVTDRLVVMDFGTKLAEGTPATIQATRSCSRPISAASNERPILSLRASQSATAGSMPCAGIAPVEAGRIVTVIGANGAGKSTLLNAVMGVLPAHGEIIFDGRSQAGRPVEARVGAG